MEIKDVPVRELLPHDPPMVLLDRAVSYTETELVAEVDIGPDTILCEADGVPGWVGIEYMAQAVAAHAGYQGRLAGEPPRIGYLLGTRSYKSTAAVFPVGATLTVYIEALFVEMGLGAFSCRIELDGTIATATINVYQPVDDSTEGIDSGKIS